MPRATILTATSYRRMPWKNGGGETVEIAISPEGAALSAFDWRISMATVATDGPFSIFPEIDRTLSVLDGEGMSLAINGRAPVLLTQTSDPLAFPADVAVSATLKSGPITDLNVMTRRGGWRHRVERIVIDGAVTLGGAAGTLLVFCHRGALDIAMPDGQASLAEGDTLLLRDAAGMSLEMDGRALCYLITMDAA
ncbi:HutD family protein [Rhizobium sp. S152]|uniref:HutD/Ves family protein n=1 Tax=Rhizobium sp. S152 TaxID=3055038 RepID=UPI0025AA0274|nr:HutD family protein [Rhizobium sp. S152]MDM9625444.1 HutD family protein [Rhizobium sp. S152]